MSKKRDLKQNINYICNELMAEVVALSLYGENKNEDATKELIGTIIVTRNDFLSRISHPEPGMDSKAYYKRLIDDFNKTAGEIVDQISSIG